MLYVRMVMKASEPEYLYFVFGSTFLLARLCKNVRKNSLHHQSGIIYDTVQYLDRRQTSIRHICSGRYTQYLTYLLIRKQ